MALRAGYYGIKKTFKDAIESLIANMSDMVIIKSLDDALSLSDAGELSVDDASTSGKGIVQLDAEPAEDSGNAITSGAVFAALQGVGSYDYSTTEFNTGQKWIDGKDIFGIVIPGTYAISNTGTNANNLAIESGLLPVIETVIDAFLIRPVAENTTPGLARVSVTVDSTTLVKAYSVTNFNNMKGLVILYTKVTVS